MVDCMRMKQTKISRGGQISVPAEIRHRWKTSRVSIDDRGDHLVVAPAPDDPIAAFRGSLKDKVHHTSDELRAHSRAEDRAAEDRRRK